MKRTSSMITDDIFAWKREMHVLVRRKINGIKKNSFHYRSNNMHKNIKSNNL